MKYLYILEIIRSKPDRWGNVYCAFYFVSTVTGNYVRGTFGSGSGENARGGVFEINGRQHVQNCYTTYTDLPIREWNRHTKNWNHVSCDAVNLGKVYALVNDDTKRDTNMFPDSEA